MVLFMLAFFCSGCFQRSMLVPDTLARVSLAAVAGAVSEADTLSAIAQIDLTTSTGHYPAKAALVLKRPLYLRLELLSVMGPSDFFIAINPQDLKILLPLRREFYRGKPSGQNLAKFLPWSFDIGDLVSILAGSYPPLPGEAAYQGYTEGNTMRISMSNSSGNSQTAWVVDNQLIKFVRCDSSGRELYTAKYEDYQKGSLLAGRITIMLADGVTSISVRYADYKIEKAADLTVFDLPAPEGFRKIMLDKVGLP